MESEYDKDREIERKKVEDLYAEFQLIANRTINTSERCDKYFSLLKNFNQQLQDIQKSKKRTLKNMSKMSSSR